MTARTYGSLFSGYGGLDLAIEHLYPGVVAVWHAENNPAAAQVLAHHWPHVPNLGDVTTIDWAHATPVDIITGGFPCQDVSAAGAGAGLAPGTRSGLWTHMAAAIGVLRPAQVIIENVRGLLSAKAAHPAHAPDLEPCPWCVGNDGAVPLRALGAVLGDLADLGYDARWCGLRAADVGAPHPRYRIFLRAWPAPADAGHGDHTQLPRAARGVGGQRAPVRRGPESGGVDTAENPNLQPGIKWGGAAPGRAPGGRPRADTGRRGVFPAAPGPGDTDWGVYGPAITRWEHTLDRPAPAPTTIGRNGQAKLSPRFVEWMMGLPDGWVCGVPGITVNDQLKILGNGVVPQQAAAALTDLASW